MVRDLGEWPDGLWKGAQLYDGHFGRQFSAVDPANDCLKIIDALTGEPFVRFIQKHQCDAVGMSQTVWGDDQDLVRYRARTYTSYVQVNGKPKRTDTMYNTHIVFPTMLRTCGRLNTTAEELARWIIALQHGRLIDKSSMKTLQTVRVLNDEKPGEWGIGGWIVQRQEHPAYFSDGAAKCAFAIYFRDDLAVVALTNLSADLALPFVDGIAGFYLPGYRRV